MRLVRVDLTDEGYVVSRTDNGKKVAIFYSLGNAFSFAKQMEMSDPCAMVAQGATEGDEKCSMLR